MTAKHAIPQSQDLVDTSDVPTVAVRELALALKILSNGKGLAMPRRALSDDDLRQVEQFFWQYSRRHRIRKVAVLLRFRSLVEAAQSRRLAAALANAGVDEIMSVLEVAANARLNARWGFNLQKLVIAALNPIVSAEPTISKAA